jgi:hypothetical protein
MISVGKKTWFMFVLILILAFSSLGASAPADLLTTKGDRATFEIRMTGAAERPGPGDPDGFGVALIRMDAGKGMVCWSLKVRDTLLPATAAHIHRAPRTDPGPVVVPLSAPGADGRSKGCIQADPALIREMMANPGAFYVNVHNTDFPPGAVRGQLDD